jgi:hypothetical protein
LLGNHCNPAGITVNPAVTFPPNPELPNGITIFPGAFGWYRNGVLIGAIGISGDGVDQDDIVGASGTHDFLAPLSIRADQFFYRGARYPTPSSRAIQGAKSRLTAAIAVRQEL